MLACTFNSSSSYTHSTHPLNLNTLHIMKRSPGHVQVIVYAEVIRPLHTFDSISEHIQLVLIIQQTKKNIQLVLRTSGLKFNWSPPLGTFERRHSSRCSRCTPSPACCTCPGCPRELSSAASGERVICLLRKYISGFASLCICSIWLVHKVKS